ncbi:transporter, cation channel family protein [Babesia caballi]|uniref:Transporter, cation channel family protein n=1 Tax=Babesia caballi TaxID=5871 RepID=A0AAV4LPF8_BABCB|nr:transporter, cation channel family protein [Babesia caballi]
MGSNNPHDRPSGFTATVETTPDPTETQTRRNVSGSLPHVYDHGTISRSVEIKLKSGDDGGGGKHATSASQSAYSGSNMALQLHGGVHRGRTTGVMKRTASGVDAAAGLVVGPTTSIEFSNHPMRYADTSSTGLDRGNSNNHSGLKYCSTTLADVSKYRKEFMMITKQYNTKEITAFGSKLYKRLLMGVVVVYSFLLGLSTMLDWNNLSGSWISAMFAVRFAFLLIFAFDVFLQTIKTKWSDLMRKFEFFLDCTMLLGELISTVYLASVMWSSCTFGAKPSTECVAMLKLLRLWSCLPLLRLYKVCMRCTQLWRLSKGILLSIRSLVWTAIFVLMVIYGCAIFTTWVFTEVEDEEMDDYWGTLLRSMYTLFTITTLEGWNEVSNDTAKHYPNSKIFFVLFVCFATLTVMNVVTGVILNTFLTTNEKLSDETFCKGRCDRLNEVNEILSSALKNPRDGDFNGNKTLDTHSPGDRPKDLSDQPTGSYSDGRNDRYMSRVAHAMYSMASRVRNVMWRVFAALRFTDNVSAEVDPQDVECGPFRGHNNPRGGNSVTFSECEVQDKPRTRDRHSYQGNSEQAAGRRNSQLRNPIDHTEFNRILRPRRSYTMTTHAEHQRWMQSPILHDLMDAADSGITIYAPLRNSHSSEGAPAGGAGRTGRVPAIPYEQLPTDAAIIDMTNRDPYTTLTDASIKQALQMAEVPLYQAYEVLNLYYTNGLLCVTVAEFTAACDRVIGNAGGKDLLSFELALARRLSVLEAHIAQMDAKLNAVLDHLTSGRAQT